MSLPTLRSVSMFLSTFFFFLLMSMPVVESDPPVVLPVCPPSGVASDSSDSTVILVSTLDGRVQALDALNSGRLLWSLPTGSGPLLRSTISELDVGSSGQFLRLIPSLSGALYKFDGSSVEPLPFDADALLRSSSFRLADSTIVAGGKENLVYAVKARTGDLVYTCGIHGCHKMDKDRREFEDSSNMDDGTYWEHEEKMDVEKEEEEDDVIVVHLETQTVKAVDARSGDEKWNFSVANHAIEYHSSRVCPPSSASEATLTSSQSRIEAFMAEGLIRSMENDDSVLWSHHFDSPIADAWRVDASGKVHRLDVFGSKDEQHERPPSLYLGVHADQYYIQENPFNPDSSNNPLILNSMETSMQWRPYLISASSRTPIYNLHPPRISEERRGEQNQQEDNDDQSRALAVPLPSGYPFDTGLYLYADSELKEQPINLLDTNEKEENATGILLDGYNDGENGDEKSESGRMRGQEVNETVVQFVIVGMGFWWREIVLISLSTAIFFNLIFFRPYLRRLNLNFSRRLAFIQANMPRPDVVVVEVPVPIAVPDSPKQTQQQKSSPSTHSSGDSSWIWPKPPDDDGNKNFVSRFLTDFEPVRCLGKGGFGVVFEARHCLDDTHYAVKRIRLPSSEHQRRKMMREVKGLAKLDHKNIVRYFNTWLEQPPRGWQEEQDEWWKRSTMAFSATHTLASTVESATIDTTSGLIMEKREADLNDTHSTKSNSMNSFDVVFEGTDLEDGTDCINGDSDDQTDEEVTNSVPNDCSENEDTSCGVVFENEENYLDCNRNSSSHGVPKTSMTSNNSGCEEALNLLVSSSPTSSPSDGSKSSLSKDKKPSKKPPVYLYIVMQLCQDSSLRDWLRCHSNDRDAKVAMDVFKQICHGVAYVHKEGLIHRDLKPSNIFFAVDGAVKIGDFGLVTHKHDSSVENDDESRREVDVKERIADDGMKESLFASSLMHTDRVGTELYMSPEQLKGRRYDHKVDVYSMGLILVELLVPFDTQMERIRSLGDLRRSIFPPVFKSMPEMPIAEAMLSNDPKLRPEVNDVICQLEVISTCPEASQPTN